MKFLLPLVLLFPVLLAAQEDKIDQLVTVDGKTYDAVTVRKVEPDGLSILHAAGTAKVPFEKLPDDVRTKYGYDEKAAAEHRKLLAKIQQLDEIEEREATAKRKQAVVDQAATEVDKEFAAKVQKAAKMVKVAAFQNSSIGLIGDIREGTLTTEAVKSNLGSTVGQKPAWVYQSRAKDGVVSSTTGAEVKVEVDSTGEPYGRRATQKEVISWEGKAWRIGKIQYTNLQGLQVTSPHYTASEKIAAAFYKKNGFSPKSDDIAPKAK